MSEDQAVTGPGIRTRRALLAGAGAVGVSAVLAGCGGDDSTNDADGGGRDTTATEPTTGVDPGGSGGLASTADIPIGGGKIFADQGVVVTQPVAGDFKAFSALCTHKQCPVSRIDGGTIDCTCHGSKFSVADGSVKQGPATEPLAGKTIKVEGDRIFLG
ncbi:Rieske (2Fe-2S) protein [Micromonospora sonneratiae]|uniref:Cytochrome bc1 complex Rieske iron-sulfur subunit n=1 Tax=Micromonospora sonneratiae TaxID=1184706 RepID=A0ABW3YDP4_9ACTN